MLLSPLKERTLTCQLHFAGNLVLISVTWKFGCTISFIVTKNLVLMYRGKKYFTTFCCFSPSILFVCFTMWNWHGYMLCKCTSSVCCIATKSSQCAMPSWYKSSAGIMVPHSAFTETKAAVNLAVTSVNELHWVGLTVKPQGVARVQSIFFSPLHHNHL